MQAYVLPSIGLASRARVRFRPRPTVVFLYLLLLLAVEMLAEVLLADKLPVFRALMRWGLVVLAIAPVAGAAFWRTRLAEGELAAGAERDLARALALMLAAEEEPNRVPDLLVKQARELSGARVAFLARPEADGYRIEIVVGDGFHHLAGQRLPINPDSPGLAGLALRTGQPALLADTWCDEGLAARRELALSDKVRSAAAVPLVVRGEVIGLLGLHADGVGTLNDEKGELLKLYAELASGPLENARLSASVNRLTEAEQLDQLKSEFLSAVAHELRAPLSPMLGWSELLLVRNYSPEEARPMLENIHEGAQHLSVLVGDLLDLSRGEAGRLALDLKQLDFGELLDAAVERWRQQAPRYHFVLAVAGGLPLFGDPNRLRQVLDNLLSNAVKYSPEGSRVFVTARAGATGEIVVRVSDQGLGLTLEERDRLFSKFYRTDSARQQAPGTGLGLALCRLILKAHGGGINVESEGPGCGSAFTFSLPPVGPRADTRVAEFATIKG